jgi:biopolymer transport protein ExbD
MRLPLRSRESPGLNMTPMIDVVFQLIIFFLLSNQLIQQETQVELALPSAASGREAAAEGPPRVTVNVLPDGKVMLGSITTQPDEIAQRLITEREHAGDNLEVRIRADHTVPYSVVEPVLLGCADAGIWNVTFAVYKRAESQD